MYGKKPRPSWWLLYLSPLILIGLFVLEMRLSLSDTDHRLIELIILLVVFGGIWIWLKANTGALIHEDRERWRAASRMASKPVPAQSEEIVRTNGNLNRRPCPAWKSAYGWLAARASAAIGLLHL
jgi:hypothetical protein